MAADFIGVIEVLKKTGKLVTTFQVFEYGGWIGVSQILDVKFIGDDDVLALADDESFALRRNPLTEVSKLYHLRSHPPRAATISKRSNALAWVTDKAVYLWNPMLERKPGPVHVDAVHDRYSYIACSDDAATVLCATEDSEVGLYDFKEKRLVRKWNAHDRATFVSAIAIKGNKGFVTGSEDGEIKVWRPDGRLGFAFTNEESIYCMACDYDSQILALGTETKIVLYDLKRILKAINDK